MADICMHFLVEGRVQGVSYRVACKKRAIKLGVRGWVRNTRDGSVEVLACGEEKQIDDFAAWLWNGSFLARVKNVKAEACKFEQHEDFNVRHE